MNTHRDHAIAELAARQYGVATAKQLHGAGLDTCAIKRQLRAGRLHRLYRGVYLVGHAVAPQCAPEFGAVLACGTGSAVSHRSAAGLWELGAFRGWSGPVDVTVPGRDPGRRHGLSVFRVRVLDPRDLRCVRGISVTSPARTLLDLVTVVPFHEVEIAFADARARGLVSAHDLSDLLRRSGRRRGTRLFRRLVALDAEHGMTRSEAERKLLGLIRTAALPVPRTNARVGRHEVDFLWQEHKLIVEVDGYAFHSGKRAFERDRERDANLSTRGYTILHVTWRQLVMDRDGVIARLAASLAVRSAIR